MYLLSEARRLNKTARDVFSKDGYHRPVMLVFKEGTDEAGVVDMVPFMADEKGKNFIAAMIRDLAIKQKITGVAIITEAWMAQMDKDNKDVERVRKGEASVSDLETKKEVLMVKVESDDGLDVMFTNEIWRDLDGTPALMEAKEVRNCSGRLGGFFAPVPDNSKN